MLAESTCTVKGASMGVESYLNCSKRALGKYVKTRVLRGRHVVSLKGEMLLTVVEEEHSRLMALWLGLSCGASQCIIEPLPGGTAQS